MIGRSHLNCPDASQLHCVSLFFKEKQGAIPNPFAFGVATMAEAESSFDPDALGDYVDAAGKRVVRDEAKAAEARAWLDENEDATAMTPERIAARGGRLANADVTLICERPKIAPHAAIMSARLAAILGVDASRVSVKATTTEKLGFTGRGEGIAAQAVATILLPY